MLSAEHSRKYQLCMAECRAVRRRQTLSVCAVINHQDRGEKKRCARGGFTFHFAFPPLKLNKNAARLIHQPPRCYEDPAKMEYIIFLHFYCDIKAAAKIQIQTLENTKDVLSLLNGKFCSLL